MSQSFPLLPNSWGFAILRKLRIACQGSVRVGMPDAFLSLTSPVFKSRRVAMARLSHAVDEEEVEINLGPVVLEGNLSQTPGTSGIVIFAHGSGSGRNSPRNRFVASQLQEAGLATLLFDLLTEEEEAADRFSGHLRFDIGLLAERLAGATDWVTHRSPASHLPVGYFGASTGGGAALVAAADRPERVRAVVSRGGRPDLARESLPLVTAPTLLIVGGDDEVV